MNLKNFFKKKKEEPSTLIKKEQKNQYYVGFYDGHHVFRASFKSYIDTSSPEHPKDANGNYINGKYDIVYTSEMEATKNPALIPVDAPYDTVTFTVNPLSVASYTNGAIYECTYGNSGKNVTHSFSEFSDGKDRFWANKEIKMQIGLNLPKMINDAEYACFVMKSFDISRLNKLGYGKIEEDFPKKSVTWERDSDDKLLDVENAEKYMKAYEHAYSDVYSAGGVVEKDGKLFAVSPDELEKITTKGVKPTTHRSDTGSNTLKR